MKRAVLCGVIACVALLCGPVVHAATHADRAVAAPGRQTATELRIPDSAFSPATVLGATVLTITHPAIADPKYVPRAFHSADYSTFGWVTGWEQNADWLPSGSSDKAGFYFTDSVFSSIAAAQKAWLDGSTYLPGKYTNYKSADCPAGLDAPCRAIFGTFQSDGPELDNFIQYNQCLSEIWAKASTTDLWSAHSDMVKQILQSIDQATIATMKIACSPLATSTPVPATSTPTPKPTPKPKPTPRPAKQPKVVVRFDWLRAMDGSNHVRSSFAVKQDLKIVLAYTVANLRPGRVITVGISRSIQMATARGYHQVAANQDSLVITRDGPQIKVYDTGGFTLAGRFRVVARMTFKRTTTQHFVDFQVR
ncbi:MAG: hypothetical protein JOZ41_08140 [Chloroflexi bacterium]|nr:hypothetical protein [Chloroflexota bacterium]